MNIPASIYATTKAHAEATHVSLTEYALTAINTHAKALPAVFAARPEPVAGPIPLASGPRQRRDVGEPLVALQMYLTPQQASALDDLVASTRAGSRSALVTEALRATI